MTSTLKGTFGGGTPSGEVASTIARHYVVFGVDERNTSQLSVTEHQPVRLVTETDINRPVRLRNRLFVIQSGGRKTLVDRDVSAALCIALLGLLKLMRGERPAPFTDPAIRAAAAAAAAAADADADADDGGARAGAVRGARRRGIIDRRRRRRAVGRGGANARRGIVRGAAAVPLVRRRSSRVAVRQSS
jgi:hypothetical protein